ncbi:hypothetical protein HMPREF9714_02148 [Myroides odoratimimus CCUG 12901]|uniref:Right handed beta helix domain-containing protein n=1 Tax=Myroides odoratimimus CCUG 10230 TaxID=883150 RepID=A0ABN0EB76_9FLAO|nr:hypothetical protein [Myroides odoratimimus]EHO08777.1 hypothetical protein HMPREF9714_02148 [Myroides odoratimimus CCUG 12901]EHO10183.1 hypothetical protein HMPREF9712_01288 [Myroides odoratimimus CCUG 10230]
MVYFVRVVFLLFPLIGFGQRIFLEENVLQKLNKNFKVEEQYIGGLKSGRPYFEVVVDSLRKDYEIKDAQHFLKVLKDSVTKGQVIYIPNELEIDLTGKKNIVIPSDITIIGDRGKKGALGARLFTTDFGVYPLFQVENDVLIKGIRIEGCDKEIYYKNIKYEGKDSFNLNRYKNPVSTGFHINGNNFYMENCEISGWTYSGVEVNKQSTGNVFKYNYFHHNRRYGLGYGITVNGGQALIVANYFDYNRHDIAGTGIPGSGYEVYLNVFLSNTHSDSIDMHGGYDRGDKTSIAGDYMYVYNNYFERIDGKSKAALLRGIPQRESFFENNYVRIKEKLKKKKYQDINQFKQVNARGNIIIKNNFIK